MKTKDKSNNSKSKQYEINKRANKAFEKKLKKNELFISTNNVS